jgi:hypothetical protein
MRGSSIAALLACLVLSGCSSGAPQHHQLSPEEAKSATTGALRDLAAGLRSPAAHGLAGLETTIDQPAANGQPASHVVVEQDWAADGTGHATVTSGTDSVESYCDGSLEYVVTRNHTFLGRSASSVVGCNLLNATEPSSNLASLAAKTPTAVDPKADGSVVSTYSQSGGADVVVSVDPDSRMSDLKTTGLGLRTIYKAAAASYHEVASSLHPDERIPAKLHWTDEEGGEGSGRWVTRTFDQTLSRPESGDLAVHVTDASAPGGTVGFTFAECQAGVQRAPYFCSFSDGDGNGVVGAGDVIRVGRTDGRDFPASSFTLYDSWAGGPVNHDPAIEDLGIVIGTLFAPGPDALLLCLGFLAAAFVAGRWRKA